MILASRHTPISRNMLHDDITVPYLVTMIDHGCYIPWLQRGGALTGQQHKIYNKRIVSKSAAGPPRYMTQHMHDIVNDESSMGINAHPDNITQQHMRCRNHPTPP